MGNLAENLVRNCCGEILWEILVGKTCGKILQEIFWEIVVGKYCWNILQEMLQEIVAGKTCGKLLWGTLVGKS